MPLNEYKDFLDQQHYAEKFDSRSNLHSSVLEEFMYYLFKDLGNLWLSQIDCLVRKLVPMLCVGTPRFEVIIYPTDKINMSIKRDGGFIMTSPSGT